jgi:di-N-acetylchitobiase
MHNSLYIALNMLQDYTCELKQVPFRGVDCSDAAGVQIGYSAMTDLVNQSITGRLWDTVAESPYAAYKVSCHLLFCLNLSLQCER